MGRKARYSAEEKISAVQEYLDGKGSMKTIAQRLGIAFQSFKQWVKNYEAMGIDAFKTNHNKHYSKAEKEQAVAAYLAGEGSHVEICQKFKILSTSQLRSWIKKYNGHEELKASRMGDTGIMTIITLKHLKNLKFLISRHETIRLNMKTVELMHYKTIVAKGNQRILFQKLKNFKQN